MGTESGQKKKVLRPKKEKRKVSKAVMKVFHENEETVTCDGKYAKYKKRYYTHNGYDILENLFLVRQFYLKHHKINIRGIELLLALYPRTFFNHADYYEIPKCFTYIRIKKVIQLGWVYIFSQGKENGDCVYALTDKGKELVKDFYKYLSGEKKIPQWETYNPARKKTPMTAIDKIRMDFIEKANSMEIKPTKKALFKR